MITAADFVERRKLAGSSSGDGGANGLRVAQAAIRRGGQIYTLPRPARHPHIIRWLAQRGICAPGNPVRSDEQGFVLSNGAFVDREEAMRVARAACQVGQTQLRDVLISEDVW